MRRPPEGRGGPTPRRCRTLAAARRAAALASTLTCSPLAAAAQSAAAPAAPQRGPAALPADCTVVDAEAAARILGYPVAGADETSRAGGVCFFASRSMSQDGIVSYAVVTAGGLPQRRAFYAVLARRCAGVVKEAPRAASCAEYGKLAGARDLDAYYAARTDVTGAEPVGVAGERAVATSDALYVRRAQTVLEVVVRRDGAFDAARAEVLARTLLRNLAP